MVISATTLFNLQRNNVALQVEVRKMLPVLPNPNPKIDLVFTFSGSRNLALRKLTNQSSIEFAELSNRAVDGDRSTNFNGGGYCTHTLQTFSPWWRVDLGQEVMQLL